MPKEFKNNIEVERGENCDGYQEYKSNGERCAICPSLSRGTLSKDHVKRVTRHIWEDYMDMCEYVSHTLGMAVRKRPYGDESRPDYCIY